MKKKLFIVSLVLKKHTCFFSYFIEQKSTSHRGAQEAGLQGFEP